MWWLTFRLQRAELGLAVLATLVILGVFAATRDDATLRARTTSIDSCPVPLSGPPGSQYCFVQTSRLTDWVVALSPALVFLPIAVAALLALPSILELGSGTYRLAWTQSVLRRRWALSRVLVMLVVGVGVAIATAFVFAWWFQPGSLIAGSRAFGWYGSWTYDLWPLILGGSTVFAIGLVLAIGTLVRRPIVSIAVSGLLYAAIRLPFSERIRPVLLPLKVSTQADYFANTANGKDWTINVYLLNALGDRVSEDRFQQLCAGQIRTPQGVEQCMTANGLTRYFEVQPYSRLVPLQLIETGIFVALGLALLGWTVWYWLRRLE
jgi:hypothetical protein